MTGDWRPDLEAVFEHYGARVMAGNREWQKATCPLLSHEDASPSASINIEAGKWSCFSCDMRGDAYDIIVANEESCAGFTDAKRFAEENFASSERAVRGEPGYSRSLSVGKGRRKTGGSWVPPWRRL